MRPVRHEDVHAAARVLSAVQEHRRDWVLCRMLREADLSMGRIRKGQTAHRIWGDGSLMTAALHRKPAAAPTLADREFCLCLARIYQAIAGRGA